MENKIAKGSKPFLDSLLGVKENVESERYFITMTTITASVFLMILCGFHIVMNLKIEPVFIAGASSIVLFVLYCFVRFKSCLFIPKLILTTLGLFLLDFTWYHKFFSLGPVLFFIFAFGALILWVWEGKQLVLMLAFYFLNILALFITEYYYVELEFQYDSLRNRSIDIYTSFFLYSSLLIFVLSRIKRDFIKQKNKAIKSEKLKSAFIANMSHEIRTPMNAIIGFSELLENEEDKLKRIKYIDIIKNSSDNLLSLIDELIDLSKIEAGYIEIVNKNFSIKDLFIELKEIYRLELEKRMKGHIEIQIVYPEKNDIICSDFIRVKQVLSNLLNNAVKFTSEGTILLKCEKQKENIVFSVSDTGVGIPEEDQNLIFDRFSKFNYEDMNDEGTGIGLSIVKKISELLKGKIRFESEQGKGSVFCFSIPYNNCNK